MTAVSRLTPEDVVSLGRYEAYARLLVDNEPQPFTSIRNRPEPATLRAAEDSIERSRDRYGVPAGEADAALENLAGLGSVGTDRPKTADGFGVRKA